ncbi:related to PDR16 - protein involved in lipid biosynthesis and multidrug resistance / PHO13 -4-nitrophenylphosphatase [Melanopsichium pennsylvanicum]|uniref:4-nitrophenylphosphatase n=2 Tax=Melanopsichium pennsylvanicum TaxID=63383 RepID=A0AAJ5C7F0_9BASI|nr:related to PDR16-protein involved in lipid biosynthesis and multidrug resistance/PHO13-4-nitrophenylphosphatase [Melanopsichium pennsylvanicum 4]SNX86444.1 related to PDR16 - protein involved in lipid biosynthesis and multidrug resistance / PHO13 -4-nitrophenylphosphatase [Melanopsichium pennsylvanicum]
MSRFFGRLSRTPSTHSINSQASAEPLPSKTSQILTKPAPGCTPKPPAPLTAQQESKLAELENYIRSFASENPPAQDYKKWEERWLSEHNLYQRYLRAAKGDLESAKKRIKSTLDWRRNFRPDIIAPGSVSHEAKTGKQVISGFDNEGRPLIYLRPARENTSPSNDQVRYLVWTLERAIDFMPEGVENYAIIIDYKGATSQSNPSLSTARAVANILQNHYVERLGRALVVNVPWFINAFFTAITPFLDPVTKDKTRFNANLVDFVPKEQLDAELAGGRYNYEFDFNTYWNTLIEVGNIAEDGTRRTDGNVQEKKDVSHVEREVHGQNTVQGAAVQKHADAIAASQLTGEGATIGVGAAAGTTAALAVVGGAAGADSAAANGKGSTGYKYLRNRTDYEELLSRYDTFLFDCDGVLWSGDETIPNVVSVLQKLRQRGKSVIFVTNNASKSRQTYLKKFAGMNIQASLDEVFSSSYASAVYLKKVLDFPADRKVYVLGMHGIEEELDAEGILHVGGTNEQDNKFLPALDFTSLQNDDAIDPKVGAVVCGFDMHMSYIKIAKAFKHLTRPGFDGPVEANASGGGCHFILTNDDSTFPAKGGPWPGAGSLSAPLVFSTKRTPTIVGKPHKPMLDCIIATKNFDPKRAIMVGDRLNTDIEFAKAGGIASMLVLTGISKRDEIEGPHAKTVPDYLIDSLGDLDAVP